MKTKTTQVIFLVEYINKKLCTEFLVGKQKINDTIESEIWCIPSINLDSSKSIMDITSIDLFKEINLKLYTISILTSYDVYPENNKVIWVRCFPYFKKGAKAGGSLKTIKWVNKEKFKDILEGTLRFIPKEFYEHYSSLK